MTVDFGLGQNVQGSMRDFQASVPHFAGHARSLWVTDHMFWNGQPTYEAWTVLAYLAGQWPEFEVGPMVLGQSYRNPGLLAKMAATLQDMSGGRFIMGIGAGWKEDEYHAYDFPFPPVGVRMEQLEDTIEILRRMWTEPGKVTYHGKHYKVVDAYCEPKPDPIPPIMVGGAGNRTMSIAARYADWWNLSDADLDRYLDRVNVLRAHCERIGRDPASLRQTWFGRVCVGRTQQEAERRGGGFYTRQNAFVGTPEAIVDDMRAFVDNGCSYFMIEVQDLPDPDVIQMVVEDIIPKVRAG
jgi:alkanesulfonate monooxygenase SsuD/methylene tetrahydromethanopterin reductase-like flavin-dependent oxidoreductase (luciferase family)